MDLTAGFGEQGTAARVEEKSGGGLSRASKAKAPRDAAGARGGLPHGGSDRSRLGGGTRGRFDIRARARGRRLPRMFFVSVLCPSNPLTLGKTTQSPVSGDGSPQRDGGPGGAT